MEEYDKPRGTTHLKRTAAQRAATPCLIDRPCLNMRACGAPADSWPSFHAWLRTSLCRDDPARGRGPGRSDQRDGATVRRGFVTPRPGSLKERSCGPASQRGPASQLPGPRTLTLLDPHNLGADAAHAFLCRRGAAGGSCCRSCRTATRRSSTRRACCRAPVPQLATTPQQSRARAECLSTAFRSRVRCSGVWVRWGGARTSRGATPEVGRPAPRSPRPAPFMST
jgi:hypothetical protein